MLWSIGWPRFIIYLNGEHRWSDVRLKTKSSCSSRFTSRSITMQCRLSLHCILPSSITLLDIVDILLVPLVGTIGQMQTIHLKATSWWDILKSKQTIWFSQRVQRAKLTSIRKIGSDEETRHHTRSISSREAHFPWAPYSLTQLFCHAVVTQRSSPQRPRGEERCVTTQRTAASETMRSPTLLSFLSLRRLREFQNYSHFSLQKRTRHHMIGSENCEEKIQ